MTIEEQNYRALVAGNDMAARETKRLISDALAHDATAFDISDVGAGTPDDPYRVESRLKIQGVWTPHRSWPVDIGRKIIDRFRSVGIGPRMPGTVQDGHCDISAPTAAGGSIRKRLDMNLLPVVQGSSLTIKVVPLA